jgi:uncharacterized protein (TIGR03083 family)
MEIAAVENRKFAQQMRSFAPDDWTKPTDCPLWDARAVAAHVVGSAAGQASVREFVRQARVGRPLTEEIGGKYWWDGMNELQVRERSALTTDELIAEWDAQWPRAVRARTRLPRLVARLPLIKFPPPVGRQSVGYLFDVGLTRDVWMHRVDIAVANAGIISSIQNNKPILVENGGSHSTVDLDKYLGAFNTVALVYRDGDGPGWKAA